LVERIVVGVHEEMVTVPHLRNVANVNRQSINHAKIEGYVVDLEDAEGGLMRIRVKKLF
jgi:hypothetical protein